MALKLLGLESDIHFSPLPSQPLSFLFLPFYNKSISTAISSLSLAIMTSEQHMTSRELRTEFIFVSL